MTPPAAPALEQAFHQTTYRIFLPDRIIDLRIGTPQPELDAELQRRHASHWVVLSPGNPAAQRLPDQDNARRMLALKTDLQALGLSFFEAVGLPAKHEDWPPEASLFILDATRAQAAALALRYDQLAWVEGALGQPARLAWSSAVMI